MKPHRPATILILALALAGPLACSSESQPDDAPKQAEADAPTNRIEIPPTVQTNLGITFVPVERRRVESTIRVPGAFELRPLARREYRLTLDATVELHVDQYQRVEPGDLLFRFRSPTWPELQHEIIAGEQDIATARAEIDVAAARINETRRKLDVLNDRLATLAQAQFKQADLEAEAAQLEAALPRLEAELALARTTLDNAHRTHDHALHRAAAAAGIPEEDLIAQTTGQDPHPVYRDIVWIDIRASAPGIVESLHATDGAFIEAPSIVLSTVDPAMVRFRAVALQADLPRFDDTLDARIVPPATRGIPFADAVNASLSIGLEAHPEQRTITLLAAPDEPRPWIRPGVSAFLEVVVDASAGPALAIPRAAVVKDGITHVFFRRDPADPNKAIRVEADMGTTDGRWVVINSGISLQDQIVLNGAYELKLASQQSGVAQKGGHFHADGTFHAEDH